MRPETSSAPAPEAGQERRKSVLPEDFRVPDLSPIVREKDGYERLARVEFPLKFAKRDLNVRVGFERFQDPEKPEDFAQVLRLDVETFDARDEYDRVSAFKSTLSPDRNRQQPEYRTKDGRPHRSWHVWYRKIEDTALRGKGFGEWNMRAVEESVRKVNEGYPDLAAEWIQLDTSLGSLSNLIVDPDWLEKKLAAGAGDEGGVLATRAANKGRNLGWVPHPHDEEAALRLLTKRWAELEDIPPGRHNDMRFLKPLVPFDPKEMFVGPEKGRRW